jgi:hypothetical protein
MSQRTEGNHKAFLSGTLTAAQYIRVKLSAGVLVVAGLTDKEIGVITRPVFGTSVPVDVLLRNANGTINCVAAAAITAGAEVYTAASGQVSSTNATGSYHVGTALDAASGSGSVVEVLPAAGGLD